MIRVLLSGCNGRMGRAVSDIAEKSDYAEIIAGIDINPQIVNCKYPVYNKLSDFAGKADVLIDFTHHSLTESLIEYSLDTSIPMVIATTGHNPEEKRLISDASARSAIFMSANMSLGVNLLIELAKKTAALLEDNFDIEIIEKHHNQKLDAPSGTALMIADGISQVMTNKPTYKYDRTGQREVRGKNEIGIHAIRGGTIVGEHEVLFAGRDELFTLSHSALSREVFAYGALKAAQYMVGKGAGMYCMKDLLSAAVAD